MLLTESKTYILWESVGRQLKEANLTATQITDIFNKVEQGVTSAGDNRTMLGKGKDVASSVNKAWEDLKTKVQDSKPIKNVDAKYDQVAEKLKQATGGDQGVMKYIQKYRDFAKKHPVAQGIIYSALIAAAGISGAGVGGAAALGLFKMVDKLLQGEKFSSAAYSGAKTGAMAYGASKVGDYVKSKLAPDEVAQRAENLPDSIPRDPDVSSAVGQVPDLRRDAVKAGLNAVKAAMEKGETNTFTLEEIAKAAMEKYSTVAGGQLNPTTIEVLATRATEIAKRGVKENMQQPIAKKLTEAQIERIFIITGLLSSTVIMEGPMDYLKGLASKAKGKLQTFGKNLTTKVTSDKLNTIWKKAGSPTDSKSIFNLLVQNNIDPNIAKQVFKSMKIPVPRTASSRTGGAQGGAQGGGTANTTTQTVRPSTPRARTRTGTTTPVQQQQPQQQQPQQQQPQQTNQPQQSQQTRQAPSFSNAMKTNQPSAVPNVGTYQQATKLQTAQNKPQAAAQTPNFSNAMKTNQPSAVPNVGTYQQAAKLQTGQVKPATSATAQTPPQTTATPAAKPKRTRKTPAKAAVTESVQNTKGEIMENVDKDIAAMLTSLKKYDKLMESVAPVLERKKPDADGDGVPDWADRHPGEDDNKVDEKAINPYAIGMAQAMKSTGDKPPLGKSTITKAHDIAKSIERNDESSMEEDTWGVSPKLRLKKVLGEPDHQVKIYHNSELGEYVVQLHTGGKHQEKSDYFTDDKEDAMSTAQAMLKRGNMEEMDTHQPDQEVMEWMERFRKLG